MWLHKPHQMILGLDMKVSINMTGVEKSGSATGSPSLVYKRDVWQISINHETRILMKIINLQHTDLVCKFCVSDFIKLDFE